MKIWDPILLKLERLLVKFLRKRGWVIFYLEPNCRVCTHICYLELAENNKFKSISLS